MNVTHVCRFTAPGSSPRLGVVAENNVYALPAATFADLVRELEDSPDAAYARLEAATTTPAVCSWTALETGAVAGYRLLAPLDTQEVWAAGVTYQRSAQAREDESQQSGIYDRVYAAERPELFFKATASRTAGSGEAVYIRSDARWNVPEPELALLVGPRGTILGYSAGNDVSSRDIEGANPLYLPQAKVYARCCGLGPALRLVRDGPDAQNLPIRLQIERGGAVVFSGETSTARMKRTPEELVRYLMLDNTFPNGAYLLTGTGIVPGDDFTLEAGDDVTITIDGIGALRNRVERAPGAGI
jgi:2-dehydro-3-deoxy-D-arabinonate dehydratase